MIMFKSLIISVLVLSVSQVIYGSLEDKAACKDGSVPNGKSCDECGKTFQEQNAGRVGVVGGKAAVAYSWPAQALIVQSIKTSVKVNDKTHEVSKSFVCGGTVINRNTVLTAAHCIVTEFDTLIEGKYQRVSLENPFDTKMFTVHVGVFDISLIAKAPAVKMTIKQVIRHPNYDKDSMINDVALYILSKPIEFNEFIQPACIPDSSYKNFPATNSSVYGIGWGTLSSGGQTATKLQNVRVTAYEPMLCASVLADLKKRWESQVCAGEYDGGKDTCQGDSGGGLYAFDEKRKKYLVIGITSYGEGCALKAKPGIYTRVSYFHDWITSNWVTE